jgi:hypothetical protein
MFNFGKQLALCDTATSRFIGHDHARHILQTLQQPSNESYGCFGIPPRLNEDVEHDAILIHGTPNIVLHALNPDEYLVEVPLIPRPWPAAVQAFGKGLAEFLAPAPNGLMGDDDASSASRSSTSR